MAAPTMANSAGVQSYITSWSTTLTCTFWKATSYDVELRWIVASVAIAGGGTVAVAPLSVRESRKNCSAWVDADRTYVPVTVTE